MTQKNRSLPTDTEMKTCLFSAPCCSCFESEMVVCCSRHDVEKVRGAENQSSSFTAALGI